MFCGNCGAQLYGQESFCPFCQTPLAAQAYPQQAMYSPAGMRVFGLVRDKLFSALCVLLTVSAGLSVISGSIPIITILAVIFLWILYSAAKRGQLDLSQIRSLYGTATASYIIAWIVFGLLLLAVALVLALIPVFSGYQSNLAEDLESIRNSYRYLFPDMLFLGSLFTVLIVTFVLLLLRLLLTVLAARAIRLFLRGVSDCERIGERAFNRAGDASTWLIILAVFGGISAALLLLYGSFFAAGASGTMCAAEIVGASLIKKYLY